MQTLIDGKPADQTVDEPYCFNGSGSYFNFRVIKDTYTDSSKNSFCWVAQNGTRMFFHAPDNRYSFATGIQDFDNKKAMMFPDTAIPTEYIAEGTYGAQRLYHEFSSMNEVKDDGYGLGNINNGSAGFNGTVKFFRYYDRVLTEEELVRNRNVDAVRYFGELGVTNVFVVAGGGTQVETGAYKVEGSWEFTAPTAIGYYTQEFVDGRWTPRKWHEGATYNYTEGTSPATVRLTWSSVPPPGMSVIIR